MCLFNSDGLSKDLPHSEHGNMVLSRLLIGTIGNELLDEELSIPLLLDGLIELIVVVVEEVLGEAGGVRPENLLAIKLGNLKSVWGLNKDDVGKAAARDLEWWGEKYDGRDKKDGGEGGNCGLCSGEDAGDDLGETTGDSSDCVGEGVARVRDCCSHCGLGVVSRLLDKSSGVSAIIESIVLLNNDDLSNCSAGRSRFGSSPVGPQSGNKKAKSSAPASISLMTSNTTSLPILLPTIVTSDVYTGVTRRNRTQLQVLRPSSSTAS